MKEQVLDNSDRPSRDDYNEFLQGLGLLGVYLINSEVETSTARPPDDVGDMEIETEFEPMHLEVSDDGSGFAVMTRIEARFLAQDESLATISATFGAAYQVQTAISDEVLAVFISRNLHIHVWPYAREYVQSTLGRFGWQPIALPPMINLTNPEEED